MTGARSRHRCAFADLVECPDCRRPITRRVPDGAPFDLDLTPHVCRADDAGADAWGQLERRLERLAAAEARERDREADLYAAWVAYRRARRIPDAGEAEVPPGWERRS